MLIAQFYHSNSATNITFLFVCSTYNGMTEVNIKNSGILKVTYCCENEK